MGQEKYTAKTLAALQSAQQIAAMKYHQEITSAHVLLALAKEPEGLLATIFEECQTDMPMLKARLEQELAKIPSVKGTDRLGMGMDMVRVLGRAEEYAKSMKDDYVSTEHLLLALATDGSSEVQDICRQFHLTKSAIQASIRKNRKQNVTTDNPEEGYKSSRSSAVISRRRRAPASSTRSSAVMRRFAARLRFFPAARRTTQCSSVNRASARRPSSKASRAASWRAMCRSR